MRASGADELARLPANAVSVEARFDTGAELEGLRRFRDLRRLVIMPPVAPMGSDRDWRTLPDVSSAL